MNAGLIFTAGFILIAAVLGGIIVSSFEDTSLNACTLNTTWYNNDTDINGNGSNYFFLANFASGGAINFTYTGSGTFTIAPGCNFSIANRVVIPNACMGMYMTLLYNDVNVTNATMEYSALQTCDLPLNTYKALKTTDTTVRMGLDLFPVLGLAVVAVFILLLASAVGFRLSD